MFLFKVLSIYYKFPEVAELHLGYTIGQKGDIKKCPCRCVYCYNLDGEGHIGYDSQGQEPLTEKEIVRLASDWKAMGIKKVVLSGGLEFFSMRTRGGALPSFVLNTLCDMGFDVSVYTSGLGMKPEDIQAVMRCKEIRFSLDSLNSKIYRLIKDNNLTAAIRNLVAVTKMRKKTESKVEIGVSLFLVKDRILNEQSADNIEKKKYDYQYINDKNLNNARKIVLNEKGRFSSKKLEEAKNKGYLPGNITELLHGRLIEMLRKLGVNRIDLKGDYTGKEKVDQNSLRIIMHSIYSRYGLEYKGMKIRYSVKTLLDLETGFFSKFKTPEECRVANNKFVIGPFGEVYPCCMWAQPGYRMMKKEMGNIRDTDSFQNFWINTQSFREEINPNSCPYCSTYETYYNITGNALNYDGYDIMSHPVKPD